MASVLWMERTAEELRALAAADAVVLLPVASTEQHGPHLAVGVDAILCEAVCRRAATILGSERAVVAPTLWCGMAEHHMDLGGTFTFDLATYRAVLLSLLRSIERGGFRRCAIVNGHGGNISALNALLPDFRRETALDLRVTTYFLLAAERIQPHLDRQAGVIHACEVETAMMMAEAPGAVREARLTEAVGPLFDDPRHVLAPAWQRFRQISEISPNGVLGDARTATPAKGERLLAACAEALAERLTAAEG